MVKELVGLDPNKINYASRKPPPVSSDNCRFSLHLQPDGALRLVHLEGQGCIAVR